MTFYYSEKDKPNYQVFSNSKSFVKKHFPQGKIKKKIIEGLFILILKNLNKKICREKNKMVRYVLGA